MTDYTLKRPMKRYYCDKDKKWKYQCMLCEFYKGIESIGHGHHIYVKCSFKKQGGDKREHLNM